VLLFLHQKKYLIYAEPLHYKYSKMANNQTVHDRKKRFVLIFCLNFPNCCDFKGQDICGMPCPPCPKKKKEPKGCKLKKHILIKFSLEPHLNIKNFN